MRTAFDHVVKILFVVMLAASAAFSQNMVAGEYDSLKLAVDNDGVLTGYFRETTGQDAKGDPKFTCTFLLRGESVGEGLYKVQTWHPEFTDEVIEGELAPVRAAGRRSVNLRLFGEHGGCWNVAPVLKDDEGVDFDLTKETKWVSLRMVSAARSYFHAAADAKSRQKAYVVKNDAVAVFGTQDKWVDVELVSDGGRSTRGWILDNTLYPERP